MAPASEVTAILRRAREDGESALNELLPLLQDELRRIAAAHMRRERADHTLQPTALVHEAFLRMADQEAADWQDRAHFLAVAALAMRQVLVDHARRRGAGKRGGGRARVTMTVEPAGEDTSDGQVDLLDLDEKLETLRGLYERPARVVELRFFGGLSFEEAGHVLGLSPRTVQADWHFASSWLRRALRAPGADPAPDRPEPGPA